MVGTSWEEKLMNDRTRKSGLLVSNILVELVEKKISPKLNIKSDNFWSGLSECLNKLAPKNSKLLKIRQDLQNTIDEWFYSHRGEVHDPIAHKKMLYEIGYLVPEQQNFTISTANVDPEISKIAGPQLVVPASNARFALNAINARWGSLYDAVYGTNVISEAGDKSRGNKYNAERGDAVVEFASNFLDQTCSLSSSKYCEVTKYSIIDERLFMTMADGSKTHLAKENQFVGYKGSNEEPSLVLLKNNGIHIEIHIDRNSPIGKLSKSGVKDVILEAAITTILDFEDSVAAVDASDKALIYENFLGLMTGELEDTFEKSGEIMTRRMNPDKKYISPANDALTLSGRSLLLVRNVGHLMTTPAILDQNGKEIPEGIMDAFFTGLIGSHDLQQTGNFTNSKSGSIYIVKPKMHGPEEVAFACEIFDHVETSLGITPKTIKIGVMDEERRTTVNLKECIRAAQDRIVFINTGFLDRTGDELHTSMEAGAFLPKSEIKKAPWINAYENWNVDIGLETGFRNKAQIGKGMWAMPDEMAAMYNEKISHPESGATTAWVPSPTGATLHAIHYHQCNVVERQNELLIRKRADLDDILKIPLLAGRKLTSDEIQRELDNNVQGILGYVVRWVDQGVGCSKVPDIDNIALMEDRATLRISSQHIANWLYHGICTNDQITRTLKKMATIVDEQNQHDYNYTKMAPNYNGKAFVAACDLIFKGRNQPSGYTEPILHDMRSEFKRSIQ